MQQHHLPVGILVCVSVRGCGTTEGQISTGTSLPLAATWRSPGAASGDLVGTCLIFVPGLDILPIIATFVLLVTIIADGIKANSQFKNAFPWK